MSFKAIIAHRIQRDNPTLATKINLRSNIFSIDGAPEELAYELKIQFIRKGGKHYGRFSPETAEFPFSAWLTEIRQDRLSFESFTKKVVEHFKMAIDQCESFIDAYLFFTLEAIEAGEFLSIYVVEHMSGLYLDSDLNISASNHLDTSGFTLAAKINIKEWEEGESATYLTLMRARGDKDISDTFTQVVGFSDKHDIKSDTIDFLKTVDQFSETLDAQTAKTTRLKAVSYCLEQNKAGKAVAIADLSENLSQEIKSYKPDHFTKYVESTKPETKKEFIADSGQLRNYVRISGRNDSLSMSFASDCLGNEIVYDEQNDILTIKNIPSALKARLLKHLKIN